MKKHLTLFLALMLAFSLCACSSNSGAREETAQAEPAEEAAAEEAPAKESGEGAVVETDGLLGQTMPDFTVTDTQGNSFTLSKALADHEAVLINLFATWCGPCQNEFPFLEEVYQAYGDKAAFIALSGDPSDTMEMVREFQENLGLTFPFGRDEEGLMTKMEFRFFPTTLVVDRFGRICFCHESAFQSAADISAVIETFLGDQYTESVLLKDIPVPARTGIFPVGSGRNITVENEIAKTLTFAGENPEARLKAYLIREDTAHVRVELPPSDNPYDMFCYYANTGKLLDLPALVDPQGSGYLTDIPVPDPQEETFFANVYLSGTAEGDNASVDVYIVKSQEALDKLSEMIEQAGWTPSEEKEEAQASSEPDAYIIHVTDQYGDPVPDMILNFCTDEACVQARSDQSGRILFDGAPMAYHLQLLKAPEGFSFDPAFDFTMPDSYGTWRLQIKRE